MSSDNAGDAAALVQDSPEQQTADPGTVPGVSNALVIDTDAAVVPISVAVPAGSPSGRAAKLLVGPVIGKLTNTTARVLVELEQTCRLEAQLVLAETNQVVQTVSVNVTAGMPTVFRFFCLTPDTRYTVKFPTLSSIAGNFKTYPNEMRKLRTAVAACDKDKASARGPVNMWERMWNDYVCPEAGGLDLLIHHGDQVYADDAFKRGRARITTELRDATREAKINCCANEYQRVYRRTWTHEETRLVLANVSNLCIWDDHELCNDWGSHAADRDASHVHYIVGLGAQRAFWWYQRQLWDDLPGSEEEVRDALRQAPGPVSLSDIGPAALRNPQTPLNPKDLFNRQLSLFELQIPMSPAPQRAAPVAAPEVAEEKKEVELPPISILTPDSEMSVHVMPGAHLAVVFMDMRASQSFYFEGEGPHGYFGEAQWKRLQAGFSAGGAFENVASVVVVHSSPSVFCGTTASARCSFLSKDKMGLGLHPEEQAEYLHLLTDWIGRPCKESDDSAPVNRSLLLIGGDLHWAMKSDILLHGKPVLRQLTTSALSNKPPMWCQYFVYRCLFKCCSGLGDGYSVQHHDFFPAQNFGLVIMDAPAGAHSSIRDEIVQSRWVCCDYRGCCYC